MLCSWVVEINRKCFLNSTCGKKKAKHMTGAENDMTKRNIRLDDKRSWNCDTQSHAEQDTAAVNERMKFRDGRALCGIITAFTFLLLLEARFLSMLGKGPKSFEKYFLFTVLTLYCLGYLLFFRRKEFRKIDLPCAAAAVLISFSIQITAFIEEQKASIFNSGKETAVFLLLCLFFYLLLFCIKNYWMRDFKIESRRDNFINYVISKIY